MKRLALVMSVAMASPASIALDFRDLIPKTSKGLIPVLTGGGLATACDQALKGRDGRAVATLVCGSLGVLVGQQIKQAL